MKPGGKATGWARRLSLGGYMGNWKDCLWEGNGMELNSLGDIIESGVYEKRKKIHGSRFGNEKSGKFIPNDCIKH